MATASVPRAMQEEPAVQRADIGPRVEPRTRLAGWEELRNQIDMLDGLLGARRLEATLITEGISKLAKTPEARTAHRLRSKISTFMGPIKGASEELREQEEKRRALDPQEAYIRIVESSESLRALHEDWKATARMRGEKRKEIRAQITEDIKKLENQRLEAAIEADIITKVLPEIERPMRKHLKVMRADKRGLLDELEALEKSDTLIALRTLNAQYPKIRQEIKLYSEIGKESAKKMSSLKLNQYTDEQGENLGFLFMFADQITAERTETRQPAGAATVGPREVNGPATQERPAASTESATAALQSDRPEHLREYRGSSAELADKWIKWIEMENKRKEGSGTEIYIAGQALAKEISGKTIILDSRASPEDIDLLHWSMKEAFRRRDFRFNPLVGSFDTRTTTLEQRKESEDWMLRTQLRTAMQVNMLAYDAPQVHFDNLNKFVKGEKIDRNLVVLEAWYSIDRLHELRFGSRYNVTPLPSYTDAPSSAPDSLIRTTQPEPIVAGAGAVAARLTDRPLIETTPEQLVEWKRSNPGVAEESQATAAV